MRSHQPLPLLIITLAAAGCDGGIAQPPDTIEPRKVAETVSDSESQPHESTKADLKRLETSRRSVGPISFTPPPKWEVRDSSVVPGLAMFAPERREWRELGFRASLGIRRYSHDPKITLDQFREQLDELMKQTVEELNATLAPVKKVAGVPNILISDKQRYTIKIDFVDGVRVISARFLGAIKPPPHFGIVAIETYGIHLLHSDSLYSITLTFPHGVEAEMDAVWKPFVDSIRIEERAK